MFFSLCLCFCHIWSLHVCLKLSNLSKTVQFVKKNISTKDSDEAFQLKVFNLKESSAHVPQANPSIQSSVPTAVKKPSAEKKKKFFTK